MTSLAAPVARPPDGVFEHRLLQYRRTFRSSIFTSFLSPVLFLTAMGLGLGALRRRPNRARRSAACRTWSSWRPACWRRRAMQSASFEATFPIMGGLVWSKTFHAMYATPISPRDIALGNMAWIDRAADADLRRSSRWSSSCFGAAAVAAHRAGDPGRGADRDGVRDADRGLLGDPEDAEQVRGDLPLRDHAALPVLGHVLPDQLAAGRAPAAGLADAALPRGGADPRPRARDARSTSRSRR